MTLVTRQPLQLQGLCQPSLAAYCMLLHVSQHDGNLEIQASQASPGLFHSGQVPGLHRGMRGVHSEACGRQRPASPPRNLSMRSRPLIRSPVQISPRTLTSVKSALSYVRDTHLCLSGTSLLSCDPTHSPCRPSRMTCAAASKHPFWGGRVFFERGNDARPAVSRLRPGTRSRRCTLARGRR